MSGFVHLHCHSTWSLLDGTIPAEHLPHLAAERGMETVAMTDHDALTGAVRFARSCRDAGVKPIFGAELTLADGGHVTVIARDRGGYANLCRLISDAHLSNERNEPTTTFGKLVERAEGLFVLSGCGRGEVARLASAGDMPEAVAVARRWRDVFGDSYRVEVFDHRGYGHRTLRDRLLAVARDAKVPAVVANDVHYADPTGAAAHEVLHAIRDIVPLSKTHALRRTSEYHMKSPAEMRALFDDVPEACNETVAIAEACEFDLDLDVQHLPDFRGAGGERNGETRTALLARKCFDGAVRRYGGVGRTVEDRLNHELNAIFRMGFASYFLLVADIVDDIWAMGIRCSCRGSATGSLVCYVLGISDVDPIRYDLLFERFMNSRRDELPDIDVDVESHRREEVLRRIQDTYGADQVALCCMVDTFRARMAIRDVGKALGLPPDEIDLVAKAFPRVAARDIPAAIERLPELAGTNLDGDQLAQLFELCLQIDGFPRHLALHPSGVVLSSPDLADRVPMQESFEGFTMLQADKDDVVELGLVKLDVLGVRMLSAIAHAVEEVERSSGVRLELDELAHDDAQAFELMRSSRTLGCFQIESPGQRELLARLQPASFEDLIVEISLFRPGPVKSDMVTPYLQRRHGFEDVSYPHPRLAPILTETHGVVVYHEQLIRAIAQTTGCSLDDADWVRRHLDAERPAVPDAPDDRPKRSSSHPGMGRGFREPPEAIARGAAVVEHFEPRFLHENGRKTTPELAQNGVEGWFKASAIGNGFTAAQVDALWREVFAFASFGFCKSHAAAFALPTYLSAYLKAHYPAEFLAGVLTHEPGMYPRRAIVAEARRLGIAILPIDVNASEATYRVKPVLSAPERPISGLSADKTGIRLPLPGVRGISDAEVASVLAARAEGGPFTSVEDLWRRAELSRPTLENLVHVEALDRIEKRSRRELLWRAAELASEARPRPGEQLSLALDSAVQQTLPDLPAYTAVEETEAELEISGIDARRHVMELYPVACELGSVQAAHLKGCRNRSQVWVCGVKTASQTPAIRSGQRIIFVTLDDATGPIDVTVFERVQPRCARTVFHSWLLAVRGELRKRGGASLTRSTEADAVGITVVVEEVFDLAELQAARDAGCSLDDALQAQRARQEMLGLHRGSADEVVGRGRLWHASGGSAGR